MNIHSSQAVNLATHIDVFYTDPANGWAVLVRDAEGNQIGEAEYLYRKSDAIFEASRWNGKPDSLPIHVFGKNGLLQGIIKAAA